MMYFSKKYKLAYINQLKNNQKSCFDSIIMLRYGETKIEKEKCYRAKKQNNIGILILIIQLSQNYLKQLLILSI